MIGYFKRWEGEEVVDEDRLDEMMLEVLVLQDGGSRF